MAVSAHAGKRPVHWVIPHAPLTVANRSAQWDHKGNDLHSLGRGPWDQELHKGNDLRNQGRGPWDQELHKDNGLRNRGRGPWDQELHKGNGLHNRGSPSKNHAHRSRAHKLILRKTLKIPQKKKAC